jgi:predicted nucleic acid-binding protein
LTTFLDACTVIYRVESVAPFNERFDQLLISLASENRREIAVSRLSLLERRVKPLRDGNAGLLASYDRFFASHGLTIVEPSPQVVEIATQIRARYGTRTPGAIQAASCFTLGQGIAFVTADESFVKLPGLRVCLLDTAS